MVAPANVAERPDHVPMLGEIRAPLLVVVGDQDEYTPVAEAEVLHARIPGAELAVIPDAVHLPNLERPAIFNTVLAGFLAKLPRKG